MGKGGRTREKRKKRRIFLGRVKVKETMTAR